MKPRTLGGPLRRSTKQLLLVAAVLPLALMYPRDSAGFEAETTHAGLTEQAAAHSVLDQRLRAQFGYDHGLLQALIVPPKDAESLFAVLRRFNPTHGYVPDGRGRQSAVSWLVAGSAIADTGGANASHFSNHFFDPTTGRGLSADTLDGADDELRARLLPRLAGARVPTSGTPAPDWITDPANPMGLTGFIDQYDKAVRSRTPGERSRHMAGALVAAGAMLHVLQDMGSPSHARNDLAAHIERIGDDSLDAGSRYERIAALAYGRLGVPSPRAPIRAASLRTFFTNSEQGTGLADITARSWFSAGTLPRTVTLRGHVPSDQLATMLARSVRRPAPVPLPKLDLFGAARGPETLVDAEGTCVARYRLSQTKLRWSMDDRCVLDQLARQLPLVAAFSAGFLDHLFRGELALFVRDGYVTVGIESVQAGAGTLELFWDDELGVRQSFHKAEITGAAAGKALGKAPAPPAGARRVTALYRGVDANGEALIATATQPLTPS